MQQHIKDRLHDDRSETFIQHYRDTYSEPENPPSWMSVEVMYFSQLSRICDGLKNVLILLALLSIFLCHRKHFYRGFML